ncbi:MAG: Rod shape-determining protein MreD [Bacteroidota bacterium]|nr:Rod shape-determining protein MreD [Bacteroidota bacterium]
MLPFEAGRITLMLIGFATGFVVDIFYDSLGIHAAACVLLMYVRPMWINLITPRGGYELEMRPTLSHMGLQWFSTYIVPLIFVHHFALFFIETGGINLIFYTGLKTIASVAFTFIIIIVVQYLFYSSRKSSI